MRFKKLKVARMLRGALGLLLALSLVLVPAVPALAVPPQPHQFYGTVTMNTEPAPEGTIVSARIGGTVYISTTVDSDGKYGYTPLFQVPADDPDTPEKEGGVAGETVEFYIGGVKAAEDYPFVIWGITLLNLSVGEALPSVLEADAGGPYTGIEGESISLSGSATGGTSPYTYAWDLDNDGAYDDATGASRSQIWGTGTAGIHTIGLQVTDSDLATATDTATVTVTEAGAINPWIYDTNNDNVMSKTETLAAIADYNANIISKAEVLAVVMLYFS